VIGSTLTFVEVGGTRRWVSAWTSLLLWMAQQAFPAALSGPFTDG
jgi:hypothetical protein